MIGWLANAITAHWANLDRYSGTFKCGHIETCRNCPDQRVVLISGYCCIGTEQTVLNTMISGSPPHLGVPLIEIPDEVPFQDGSIAWALSCLMLNHFVIPMHVVIFQKLCVHSFANIPVLSHDLYACVHSVHSMPKDLDIDYHTISKLDMCLGMNFEVNRPWRAMSPQLKVNRPS